MLLKDTSAEAVQEGHVTGTSAISEGCAIWKEIFYGNMYCICLFTYILMLLLTNCDKKFLQVEAMVAVVRSSQPTVSCILLIKELLLWVDLQQPVHLHLPVGIWVTGALA